MKKYFFILLLPFIFLACRKNNNAPTEQQEAVPNFENIKNGTKVRVFYNTPGVYADTGRGLTALLGGYYEFKETYNLSEFDIPKIGTIFSEEKLVEAENEEDRNNIIMFGLFMDAETMIEILDDNDCVVFRYLYFTYEKFILWSYFPYGEEKVYRKTSEIEDFSRKVIERACKDHGVKTYFPRQDKEELRKLEYGTPLTAVINEFGKPDKEIGSGFVIVGYELEDHLIVLHFYTGESLCGMWEEFQDGTEKVILPIKFPKE